MSAEARQWLAYAEENRQVALLCQENGPFNPSLQNSQQAVEKGLLDTIYLPSKYQLASVLPAFTPDAQTARQCLAIADRVLVAAFGPAIRDLVQELTDDKRLLKADRKARQVATAAALFGRAKLIRNADKPANIRDVTCHPPATWDLACRRGSLEWTATVVVGCRGVNEPLEARDAQVLQACRASLRA